LIEAASERDVYFVPSGTTLNNQLLNFQREKRRMAFVVDEYGDIQGLVTLETSSKRSSVNSLPIRPP